MRKVAWRRIEEGTTNNRESGWFEERTGVRFGSWTDFATANTEASRTAKKLR
jgi:hypothetical protein